METIKKVGNWIVKSKLKVIVITFIALFCAATIYAAAANSYTITIEVGDSTKRIVTLRTDAYEILDQANIEIEGNDIVDLSEFVSSADSKIIVYKACKVKITDGDNEAVEYEGIASVAKTLADNGIELTSDDVLNVANEDKVYEGMEIVITRAFPVTLAVDGEISRVNIAGGTIEDLLDKAVVTVDDDDVISQPLNTPLEAGMAVKVTHITVTQRTETVAVPFEKSTEKTNTLYVGQSKVKQTGVNGEKIVTYSEKYVGGVLTESTAIKTDITKESVKEIKLVGTKANSSSLSADSTGQRLASGVKTISNLAVPSSLTLNGNVPTSYKKKIVGTASAYSGGGTTATGRAAQNGYIAVNPNQIPYHTKMWIVSNDGNYVYGYASAEDTGGFVNWSGSRSTLCDLYFSSSSQACAFGRRSVTIYVL